MLKTKYQKLDLVIEALGIEETLNALAQSLSSDELNDNMDYIIRVYDLDIEE